MRHKIKEMRMFHEIFVTKSFLFCGKLALCAIIIAEISQIINLKSHRKMTVKAHEWSLIMFCIVLLFL